MAAPNRLLTPLFVAFIMGVAVWIYWPTLIGSGLFWPAHSDDWHYFLIPLLSLALLWIRRDEYPSSAHRGHLRFTGILLIGISPALLVGAMLTRMPMLAGVSLVAWVAGVVWLLGGVQLLKWAWPSILLLAFVIPVPPLVANKLSAPLQSASASVGCYLLHLMRFHAIEVGPTVVLGDGSIDVASYHVESSVLHSTLLIGFASLMIRRRTLVEGGFLIGSVLPILILVTATRVAAAAIALHADVGTAGRLGLLAYARWAPVPAAALLFTSLIAYLSFVMRQVEYAEIDDIVSLPRSARCEPI